MNKKEALILSFLITLLVASNFYFFSFIHDASKRETVLISRVIDGDTLVLTDGRRLRFLNINAPEKNLPISGQATNYMKKYEGKSLEIEISGTDMYQRYLARLYSPVYLNLEMVKLGLASKFLVQESELKQFANAEEDAIKNSKGIWVKSLFFGCLISKIDEKSEIVYLTNSCGDLDLNGWSLKDESRKTYTFHTKIKNKVNLHSLVGKDNSTDLFWNQKTDVWNNDRDTLYLFDSEGKIVYSNSYGY